MKCEGFLSRENWETNGVKKIPRGLTKGILALGNYQAPYRSKTGTKKDVQLTFAFTKNQTSFFKKNNLKKRKYERKEKKLSTFPLDRYKNWALYTC